MTRTTRQHLQRALLIIDVEPKFLTPNTISAVDRIARLIARGRYALYVVAEYSKLRHGKRVLHKTQWQRSYGKLHDDEQTVPELEAALDGKRVLRVVKSTRSMFGSDAKVATALRRRGIREVHIVGLETHDCVLATALDAFDYGFTTFVMRNACASKRTQRHEAACTILRGAKLLR